VTVQSTTAIIQPPITPLRTNEKRRRNPNSPDFRRRVSKERAVSPEIRNLVNVMFPPSHHDEDSDANAGME
jgi:hypothetical protein